MSDLLVKKDDHVLYITINRPSKKNALSPELLEELADVLDSYANEERTLVPVITGSGSQFFSSGYDISRIPTMGDDDAVEFANYKPLDRAVEAIENFPYPVIAMLNGSVYGGACEIVFACDFRYASEGIVMSMPPAKLGVVYSLRGLQRVRNVIGISNLKKMIYTAGKFDTSSLFRIGAVDEVLPSYAIGGFVDQTAREIGQLSPISHQGHKQIFGVLERKVLKPEDEELARFWLEKSYLSEDVEEGKRAFMEKRKPEFKGR